MPINEERPEKAFLDVIHEELTAIDAHLNGIENNPFSHLHFNLGTALTSNIRNPVPRLIDDVDLGISLNAQYVKHRCVSRTATCTRQVLNSTSLDPIANIFFDWCQSANTHPANLSLIK
jgi:hypothetical protein